MIRILMLHHAYPPDGPDELRGLLGEIGLETDIAIEFISISDIHLYQSEKFGETATTHRLNVFRTPGQPYSLQELAEFQAKSYIFILRTARKVRYDAIHALGEFPEAWVAYLFRDRFPYFVTPMPTDAESAATITAGTAPSLTPLTAQIRSGARHIFPAGINDAAATARLYAVQYRALES